MLYNIHAVIYSDLRAAAGLTQRQLAEAARLSRSTVQRIESGHRPPTREEEAAILEAADCSRLLFAELVCKALTDRLDLRVAILDEDAGDYRAATPQAEAYGLLAIGRRKMPQNLWWSWKERLSRVKAQILLIEQESFAIVRDLQAQILALAAKEQVTGSGADSC